MSRSERRYLEDRLPERQRHAARVHGSLRDPGGLDRCLLPRSTWGKWAGPYQGGGPKKPGGCDRSHPRGPTRRRAAWSPRIKPSFTSSVAPAAFPRHTEIPNLLARNRLLAHPDSLAKFRLGEVGGLASPADFNSRGQLARYGNPPDNSSPDAVNPIQTVATIGRTSSVTREGGARKARGRGGRNRADRVT